MRLITLAFALAAILFNEASAYGKTSPHYGAGRRIPFDSIKTLTFYDGRQTAARRTSPLPQLNCEGKLCRKFQPDVVSCQSLGDGQWKCEADLPSAIRLERVEVSCEGYESPQDPYVLKDSCALTYRLLPAYGSIGADEESMRYRKPKNMTLQDVIDFVFPFAFIGALGWILWGFVSSLRRGGAAGGGGARGTGGWGGGGGGPGGWGGGPGGWGSGWGSGGGPPPPYSKTDPTSSSSSSTQGTGGGSNFWTGAAAGAAAGVLGSMLAGNRRRDQRRAYEYDPYAGGGGLGAGWTGGGGGRAFGGDSFAGPSGTRSSTGYGGTRNR